jgi:hypothetical protein
MSSTRNVLRYGPLDEVSDILENRVMSDPDEIRAIFLNLCERLRRQTARADALESRIETLEDLRQ